MSSNIEIPKVCNFCDKTFIAKTFSTKFCSHNCSRKAWKLKIKNAKILAVHRDTNEKLVGEIMGEITSKEFLSIKETCLLLGISRMSLHRYLKSGLIKPIKLGGRIIIPKKSITNLIK